MYLKNYKVLNTTSIEVHENEPALNFQTIFIINTPIIIVYVGPLNIGKLAMFVHMKNIDVFNNPHTFLSTG